MRWCTNESRLALATIASPSVRADRRGSAGIFESEIRALVEIRALGTDGFETVLAEALSLDALGIVDAIEIRLAESRHVGLRTHTVDVWFL